MKAELVRTETADGVRLDGAFLSPPVKVADKFDFDAALLVHGTGANFYSSSLLRYLAQAFRDAGVATVLANTRGRDLVHTASTSSGPRLLGAAHEIVGDCKFDLPAWLNFLRERGYTRPALVGHSLGAVKGVFTLAQIPQDVVRLIAISPARLSYAHFMASDKAELFRADFAAAESCVACGAPEELLQIKFPIPYSVTAAGYLDKYGPQETYNVLNYIDRLKLPTLFTFGTKELVGHPAFRGLPEAIETVASEHGMSNINTAVIADADHFYSGTMSELWNRVRRWLAAAAK
ncbi:MAG: alpha/beta hydrolase [Pirellulales bacterium]|nr:alpha/beta hydrolase [Pirellulales bacterium]